MTSSTPARFRRAANYPALGEFENGLQPTALRPKGFLKRLTRTPDKENGVIEVANLLASGPIVSTSMSQVADILNRYNVGFGEVRSEFLDIMRTVLTHHAEDGELTDSDRSDLAHLQKILSLADDDVKRVREAVLADLYAKSVTDALADAEITPDERKRLGMMAASFGLPEVRTREIYRDQVEKLLQWTLERMTDDRRFTEAEEKRLADMASKFGVELKLGDEKTQALLERFKRLARIEAGHLPIIRPLIHLQRGETCHATFVCTQSEIRQQTTSYRYSGLTASVKIVKGLRWRVGQVSVQRITRDAMLQLDSGALYITSKRLFFDGAKKNTTIALSRIVHFTVFSDGLCVEKDTGRDQYFIGTGDLDVIGAVMDSVISASR